MADKRKYYVLCADNCKFEGMTKEQIMTAIEQAISTGEIKNVDSGFITTIKEQNAQSGLKFWVGTIAEFNALTEMEDGCLYIFTDENIVEDIDAAFVELEQRTAAVEKKVSSQGKVLFDGEIPNSTNLEELNIIVEGLENYEIVKIANFTSAAICTVQSFGDSITIHGVGNNLVHNSDNTGGYETTFFSVEIIFAKQNDGKWKAIRSATNNIPITCYIKDGDPYGEFGFPSEENITKIIGLM